MVSRDWRWRVYRLIKSPSAASEVFRRELEQLRDACKHLAAGVDHPVVKEVMERPGNSAAGRKALLVDLTRTVMEYAQKLKTLPDASNASAVDEMERMLSAVERSLQLLEKAKGTEVKAATQGTSVIIFDFYHARFVETEQACRNLMLTANHPRALQEVARLREVAAKLNGTLDSLVARIVAEVEALVRELAEVDSEFWKLQRFSKERRAFDKQELSQLVTAICGEDHERDGDEADALAAQMTAKIVAATKDAKAEFLRRSDAEAATLRAVFGKLGKQEAELQDMIARLEKDKRQRQAGIERLRTQLRVVGKLNDESKRGMYFGKHRDDRQAYENVANELLLGQNNPRTAAASKYGREQHKELQKRFNCDKKEFEVSGGRADCVLFDKCVVIEFKPDSYSIRQAQDQAQGYVAGVSAAFSKENSKGQAWSKCWEPDGPTAGQGFKRQGFLYPRCTGGE